jgi:hypothetical protein
MAEPLSGAMATRMDSSGSAGALSSPSYVHPTGRDMLYLPSRRYYLC